MTPELQPSARCGVNGVPSSPVIGLPCARHAGSTPRHLMSESYIHALTQAGAMPLLIPLIEDEGRLRAAYERLDGLLLAGGGDVDPTRYGEPLHPATRNVDPRRDEVEMILLRWALADRVPILAICRGIQMLNVAAGGTLYQDVAQQLPDALKHDYYPHYPRTLRPHRVTIAPDSLLATILGDLNPAVNSLHHQGVKVPAPDFAVVARAPDGLIEGIEHPTHPFALGVQWHPEDLIGDDPSMRRLFRAFVEAAQKRASSIAQPAAPVVQLHSRDEEQQQEQGEED